MKNSFRKTLIVFLASLLASTSVTLAQVTLGGITGTVTDSSGSVIPNTSVALTGDTNGYSRTSKSNSNGQFSFLNLPIGAYTLTFTRDGFDTTRYPAIAVQENNTTTLNVSLKAGSVNTSVTVNETPLLNAVDTTNGYTLDKAQIEATPLATGSFTQLAVLAPGVSAELLNGIGTNAGLGNQPIWANGQRDTSNSFQVNGVDVSNLFNGKSSSQSASQRLNFNVGENNAAGGNSQTNTSVYASNGEGLAAPPPEMIQELRVNTSMYDAQQGTSSGAHVDVNTQSGGNGFHGQLFGTRATDWINAAQFFLKQDPSVPDNEKNPQLHRWTGGGTLGGPIFKDKLFFFAGYERQHVSDQFNGISRIQVPSGLTDDRSAAGIAAALASYNGSTNNNPNPVAVALLQYKFPNGQYLIPSAGPNAASQLANFLPDASILGYSLFTADQANGALDYNASANDRVSAKYYYQHSPVTSPFGVSSVRGFAQHEDAGTHVAALGNTITIGPRFNWEQRVGLSRQKVYSNFDQALNPSDVGINVFSSKFPGLSLGQFGTPSGSGLRVGPSSDFVDAGYFQNRLSPSTNAILSLGRHTVSAGASFSYTQLNIRNNRANSSTLSIRNFPSFLKGQVRNGTDLLGSTNRYYRTREVGSYVQDKWQARSNLSITAGLRYDYNGPLTEKYGNLFNFEPSLYSVTPSTINNTGFIVAGNNKNYATKGVSDSTLTGRQWGFGPRIGFAYSPERNAGRIVVRGGFGLYYDRGEYFSYLSQPAGAGVSGPFGVTQAPPLASYINASGNLTNPFGTTPPVPPSGNPNDFASFLPTQNQIRSTCTAAESENAGSATNFGCAVKGFPFGAYDRRNVLPYSMNFNFDVQYQLASDLAFTLGYVGNRSRHLVIPLPFNQPGVATPGSPINGETATYGYQVLSPVNSDADGNPLPLSSEPYDTYDGGNVDLRVPFVGYDPNSTLFRAAGTSAYDALQFHAEKRLSRGVQVGFSYTWSHTLDEQSDLGLFFTGDNPNKLRDSYASADFDRTNVVSFNYLLQAPSFKTRSGLLNKAIDGWSLRGITILQSGQPYSVYDYSGAIGSIYYGTNVSLLNPIVPLAPGYNPRSALSGHVGAFKDASGNTIPALNPAAFTIPSLSPGQQGVPACDSTGGPGNGPLCDIYETQFTSGQRNIFRQSFQKRADISLQKITRVNERVALRYTFDVFNLTNTPSFDIPGNNVSIDPNFGSGSYGNAQVFPTGSTQALGDIYTFPTADNNQGLGVVNGLIGGPRVIEMSLHLVY